MNIGLFYGSSTCYTEMAAEKIRDIIGPELVTLHNLKDDAVALMEQYDVLILASQPGILVRYRKTGKPSGINSIQSISTARSLPCTAWEISWVTGNGSWTHSACCTTSWRRKGCRSSATGQPKVTSSPVKPIIADGELFVGLALDETNQYDLSDERLQTWCEQILGEMAEKFS